MSTPSIDVENSESQTEITPEEKTADEQTTAAPEYPFTDSRVTQSGDTITRVRTSRGEIVILGTAHVSEDSALEVDRAIRDNLPGKVCIELDENRYKTLNQENSWKNLNIFQVIKQRKAFLLMSNLVLSAYQKRLGLNLGTKPGDEMRAAIKTATELGIPTAMIDRDIQTTLTRAWRKTGFWGRNKILAVLLGSAFSREELDEEAIEGLKSRSALDDMMKEMAEFLPAVKEVLIDERDHYLAINSWREAATVAGDKSILSVVGAGHVPGMVKKILELDNIFSPAAPADATPSGSAAAAAPSASPVPAPDTPASQNDESSSPAQAQEESAVKEVLSDSDSAADSVIEAPEKEIQRIGIVPPPTLFSKMFPWLIVLAIVGLFVRRYINGGYEELLVSFKRWILINGSLSAVGSLVALANPLTIIASFIAAPITSLIPVIGVGFVTGSLESILRKPKVEDFENLGDDITSVKGFFRNRVSRILLVFFFSSLGSAIGTFLGGIGLL